MQTRSRLKVKGAASAGADRLLRRLRKLGKPIPTFCEETGLPRFAVENILAGRAKRIYLDMALDLVVAARSVGVETSPASWSLRTKAKRAREKRAGGLTDAQIKEGLRREAEEYDGAPPVTAAAIGPAEQT